MKVDLKSALESGSKKDVELALSQTSATELKAFRADDGATLIMELVRASWADLLERLLESNADRLLDKTAEGFCGLLEAAKRGNLSCLKVLLNAWEKESIFISDRAARIQDAFDWAKKRIEKLSIEEGFASEEDKLCLALLVKAMHEYPVTRVETQGAPIDLARVIEEGAKKALERKRKDRTDD